MTLIKTTIAATLALSVFGQNSYAGNPLENIALGGLITGPEISPTNLEGEVLILEFWGRNCPPCIASLPHLSHLAEEHADDGLRVIAAHRQGGTNQQVLDVWNKHVDFAGIAVYDNGRTSDKEDFGIPAALVYNRYGEIVFNNSPHADGFDEAIEAALNQIYYDPKHYGAAQSVIAPLQTEDETVSEKLKDAQESLEEFSGATGAEKQELASGLHRNMDNLLRTLSRSYAIPFEQWQPLVIPETIECNATYNTDRGRLEVTLEAPRTWIDDARGTATVTIDGQETLVFRRISLDTDEASISTEDVRIREAIAAGTEVTIEVTWSFKAHEVTQTYTTTVEHVTSE